jgi:hypothetical protein
MRPALLYTTSDGTIAACLRAADMQAAETDEAEA